LKFVKNELRTFEVCINAVLEHSLAIEYVPNELLELVETRQKQYFEFFTLAERCKYL
jgi:hypothetical protein